MNGILKFAVILLTAPLVLGCQSTGKTIAAGPGTGSGLSTTPTQMTTPAQVLAGEQYFDSSGTLLTGTMATGESFTGNNGILALTVPQGYYDGTKTATAADSNLVAGNIVSGISIFGITGSASGTSYGACTDNALNASQCATATSRYVSPTLGAAVSGSNGSLTATVPEGFYNGSTSCSMSDTNLTAGNIMGGVTIFGVTGSITNQGNLNAQNAWPGAGYYGGSPTNLPATSEIVSGNTVLGVAGSAGFASLAGSNASRTLGTTQITEQAETATYGTTTLPTGYRDVPKVETDDDGYAGGNVTYATRPTVTCGTTQTTVAARIAACVTANGASATWSGATNGNAGQGTWYLVTYAGNNSLTSNNAEVWQDARTGLLWSSAVGASNWCEASGNAESTDPSNYCNSTTYQPHYPSAESYCAETGTIPATASEAVGSTVGGAWSGSYLSAKGSMGAQSSASSPSVYWRLPTMYDYEQANIDGIRLVMPDMGTSENYTEWTATIRSTTRTFAWYFTGGVGYVENNDRTTTNAVRCVGR